LLHISFSGDRRSCSDRLADSRPANDLIFTKNQSNLRRNGVMRQAFALLLFLAAHALSAQTLAPAPPNQPLSLADALAIAQDKYPAIKTALEQQAAAQHQIGVAKTVYLPRLDVLWQTNRATDNNRTGLLLPQSVLPSISGPVAGDAPGRSAWSSAGGALMSWQPFDFGARAAQVNVAQKSARAAVSATDLTRLGIVAATSNAYLDVVAAHQLVTVAQANVRRMQTFAESVHVLVNNKLRPGADASQADAQLALVRTQLIQAQTQERVRLAALADFLELPGQQVKVDAAGVLSAAPAADPEATSIDAHPAVQEEAALIERQRAQLQILSRSYVPVFNLLGSISGRGTGIDAQGNFMGGTSGLAPNTLNWAGAVQVTFPAFDIFTIQREKKVQAANVRAEQMRYQQTVDDLSAQVEQALATLDGAKQIAQNTPLEVAAARQSEQQQRTRFQSSLATVVEVAVAESVLTQAEGDDAIARINVWRALASLAAARGDVAPFLKMLGK
jgi:outer membrane protein